MPLTKPITCEDAITVAVGTTLTGLIHQWTQQGVGFDKIAGSVLINTAIFVNHIVRDADMQIVDKVQLRKAIKDAINEILDMPLESKVQIIKPNIQ